MMFKESPRVQVVGDDEIALRIRPLPSLRQDPAANPVLYTLWYERGSRTCDIHVDEQSMLAEYHMA